MRLVLCGDTHANPNFFDQICYVAVKNEVKTIYQLGDWGAFPTNKTWFPRWLKQVDSSLLHHDLECYFHDGNHDDYNWLNSHPDRGDGFLELGPRLFYSPRGHRWTWDGVRFMSMGGAYSIDKDPDPAFNWKGRTEGINWWPEEMITAEQTAKAIDGDPIDILLSHDLPTKANIPNLRRKDQYPATDINRAYLQEIVDALKPGAVITGHWHDSFMSYIDYPIQTSEGLDWHRVLCRTLAHDGVIRHGSIKDAYVIVDTEDLPPGADRSNINAE